jgi:hypothetical protein
LEILQTYPTVQYFNPEEERGNRLKQKLFEGCIRFIDIFCVWNCGFPFQLAQKYISLIVFDPFAELLITLAIGINTLFMALDHYGLKDNPQLAETLKAGNVVGFKYFWHFDHLRFMHFMFLGVFHHIRCRSWNETDCIKPKILFSSWMEYF